MKPVARLIDAAGEVALSANQSIHDILKALVIAGAEAVAESRHLLLESYRLGYSRQHRQAGSNSSSDSVARLHEF